MSAVGTFVSGDKKGGSNTFGGNFLTGVGREARGVTLKNARSKIVSLTQQLRLRKDHVDMSFHFYKLALNKGITRGRKSAHVIAACVYITCRTEATGHMLIDISDVLEVDVYQLGRAYLRLSQELCINIPVMDPCVYVMRYAPMLEFGEKTHEVSNTALRLLSRMKKDWIHFGRRPSGLCGAALLISSRLHEFNRSLENVLKVVKVHESTLRKRLNEFSQTSASELTLDEFFTVDLDALPEMDPPCYTAGRQKDQELLDREGKMSTFEREMSKLEEKIEKELEERRSKVKRTRHKISSSSSVEWSSSGSDSELEEVKRKAEGDLENFLAAETMGMLDECLKTTSPKFDSTGPSLDRLLMPPPSPVTPRPVEPSQEEPSKRESRIPCSPGLGLKATVEEYLRPEVGELEKATTEDFDEHELDLTGIDEDEIDSFLLTPEEVKFKTQLWHKVNQEYLEEQRLKLKKEKEEREEMIKQGIDPDKKKKVYRKRKAGSSGTAVEAIEKMALEKKISTKINYDVLKNLSFVPHCSSDEIVKSPSKEESPTSEPFVKPSILSSLKKYPTVELRGSKKMKMEKKPTLVTRSVSKKLVSDSKLVEPATCVNNLQEATTSNPDEGGEDDLSDLSDDEPLQPAAELLCQQFGVGEGDGDWGEEEYYY